MPKGATMPDTQVDKEIDQLQEIMDELFEEAPDVTTERRKYSLTRGDVILIYRIAKIARANHICPFEEEEAKTLQTVANSITKTQKIASAIIITAAVTTVLSGVWFAIKHVFTEWVKGGIK